jgi:tellurite resistance protein
MKTRAPIPASLFGIPVGVLGLSNAWNVGARLWHLPPIVGHALGVAGASIWSVLLILYAQKWWSHRAAAQQEAQDPFLSSFVALVFISTMLVSISALPVSRPAATALFGISLLLQLALGLWLLGRTWQGGNGADFPTPALYLPGVGQNFVAANCAALFGWPQIGAWLLGCGVFSWLAIESIVLGRAATREAIPPAMRPALGVQLAPPVVGGIAYLSLTTGAPDLMAHMLFGYGLYQAALLLRLSAWIRQPSFSPGYWSFSFGATALPEMAMRMLERGDSGPVAWAAMLLFVGANLVIAYLALSTVRLLVQRRHLPTTGSATENAA